METLAELERQGYAVLPDVLTADEVRVVRDALAPYLDRGPRGRNEFEGFDTAQVKRNQTGEAFEMGQTIVGYIGAG